MKTRFLLPVLILLSGCAREREVFTVGLEVDYPPWSMIDAATGEHRGFDVELVKTVCERLSLRPVFRSIVWSEKRRLLEAGEIDCVMGGFTTTGREGDYAILGPYVSSYYVFVVRSDSGIGSFADLEGRVFGCQTDTTQEQILEGAELNRLAGRKTELPRPKQIVKVAFGSACIKHLENGTIDAVLFDSDLAESLRRRSDGRFSIVPGERIHEDWNGAGFRKNDTARRDMFARAIGELAGEGLIAPIVKKYFGSADRWQWRGAVYPSSEKGTEE